MYEDIRQHEAIYTLIVENSKENGEKLKSRKEKKKLASSVENVTSKWEIVSSQAKEHRDNVAKILTIVCNFHENLQSVVAVISKGDDVIKSATPVGFDVAKGRMQLKNVRVSHSRIHLVFS